MGEKTGISWTDHTFNIVWGCSEINEDCDNCYARTLAERFGYPNIWGLSKDGAERRLFGEKHWADPLKWNRHVEKTGVPEKVFCSSMADVFDNHPALSTERQKLWTLIEQTPHLIWQLLTKRPSNILKMLPTHWMESRKTFPQNVWLGTSAGTQKTANAMVSKLVSLKKVPSLISLAPVLFVSVEPQTEYVDLTPWLVMLDWVIVGGESGPNHRPFDPAWALDMRDKCDKWGVSFFFKQHGGLRPTDGGHLLEGQEYHTFPRIR